MEVSVGAQLELFGVAVLLGLSFGLAYEICRVPRLLAHVHPVLVFLTDILYAFLASGVLFVFTFIRHDGQLRLYLLLATAIGLLIYEFTLGQVIVFLVRKIKPFIIRKQRKG